MCACVSTYRLLITNGVMWPGNGWLNKFYNIYMADVIDIVSRCGLSIDAHNINHPNMVQFNRKFHATSVSKTLKCNAHVNDFMSVHTV